MVEQRARSYLIDRHLQREDLEAGIESLAEIDVPAPPLILSLRLSAATRPLSRSLIGEDAHTFGLDPGQAHAQSGNTSQTSCVSLVTSPEKANVASTAELPCHPKGQQLRAQAATYLSKSQLRFEVSISEVKVFSAAAATSSHPHQLRCQLRSPLIIGSVQRPSRHATSSHRSHAPKVEVYEARCLHQDG